MVSFPGISGCLILIGQRVCPAVAESIDDAPPALGSRKGIGIR
jgi:hypothetical protein